MKPVILYRDDEFFSNHAALPVWNNRRRIMTSFMLVSDLVCVLASMSAPVFFVAIRASRPGT
mgnify:CR=1 FL=1